MRYKGDGEHTVIKRLIELEKSESIKFLETSERYARTGSRESFEANGNHSYACSILTKLIIDLSESGETE